MKARIFTLLTAIVIFINPIYSQSEWWEDLDPPMDTIYVSSCEDIDILMTQKVKWKMVDDWVFPDQKDYPDISGSYTTQKIFDADSNCVEGIMAVSIINWLNLELYEFDRVILLYPDFPGPCGEEFVFKEKDIADGIHITELDSTADDISFFANGSQNPLNLQISQTDTFDIPIFHITDLAVCFVSIVIEAEPPCINDFILEAKDEVSMHIGTDFCTKLTLDDVELNADYYCMDFDVGFLRADNSLSDHINIDFDPENPNRNQELTIVMRTEDDEEFSINLNVIVTVDDMIHNNVYLFSDNPYLQEGEITYMGVGGDFENLMAFQAEIVLNGAKFLEITDIHPNLPLNSVLYYNITEEFFRFLFYDAINQLLTFQDGIPWFVIKIEALQDGYLSELMDTNNPNNFNMFHLGSQQCTEGIPFNFSFTFSQQLLFSNTSDLRLSETIEMYPNPASDRVYFDMGDQAIDQITIFDLNGRIIRSEKHSENWVDVSRLQAGYYFVVIDGPENQFRGKFIKK